MASLIDVYNDLKPKNCFEVVFVFVDHDFAGMNGCKSSPRKEMQIFEEIFSLMPWTAIPFSDMKSREYLKRRFGIRKLSRYPIAIVVGSTGTVLHPSCELIIDIYGSPAVPFSDERLASLDSEDDIMAVQPSLKSLLVSPQRDYVISNKGEKVPIHTLEDKVVALFFYEEGFSWNTAEELKVAYEELARNHKNFEVVLIYLTDTCHTCKHTNEEEFKETFKTMPWLALPFKDPVHKKLKRVFDYTQILQPDMLEKVPSLVIFGPQGEFIEPCGADVLSKFGVSAYPFTREHIVKSETKKLLEFKLDMLFSPTTVFKTRDGSQVQFSHFAGKRVILYIESLYWDDEEDLVTFKEVKFLMMLKEVEFLKMLKERYLQLKGTSDEFEVIYITYQDDKFCYNELVADAPWFVSPASKVFEDMQIKFPFSTYYVSTGQSTCFSRFISFGSQPQFTEAAPDGYEKGFEKGDIVNLSQLVFAPNRDYLIRYNHPQLVTAEQLAGKVIVLYFAPLHPSPYFVGNKYRLALLDTYNDLKSNNCFEVVLVVVDDVPIFSVEPGKICADPSLQGKFNDICSQAPSWPAIPFSDITSRHCLKRKLRRSGQLCYPMEVLIDSRHGFGHFSAPAISDIWIGGLSFQR